jgi:hypothetical protein
MITSFAYQFLGQGSREGKSTLIESTHARKKKVSPGTGLTGGRRGGDEGVCDAREEGGAWSEERWWWCVVSDGRGLSGSGI